MAEPKILTERQRKFLSLFAEEKDLAQEYVLSGGTALAEYYLHHRLSEDLDFFTQNKVDAMRVRQFVEKARDNMQASDITSQKLYDRHIFLLKFSDEELKVEFTQYPFSALEKEAEQDGVLIASLRDIATGKLFAIFDRFEPKDYFDLYVLLKNGHTTIEQLREDLHKK